ncbi:MAG: endo alpha-1,4 polygalactosaminidase [Nannocystaceae bacterium]
MTSSTTAAGTETSAEATGTTTDATATATTGAGTDTDATTSGGETTAGTSTTATTDATTGTSDTDGAAGCSGGQPGLWCPAPGLSWQWQIDGQPIDTSVDVAMYDIDLFDVTDAELSVLKADGRAIVCYFSAGSHEEWRPDAAAFPAAAIGDPLDGWPGERWLDVRDATVREVQAARIELAAARGCDGVEPDNVDGYSNASGFPLTADDQLDYNRFLAAQAHAHGLSIGLKNDLDQIPALEEDFDWALNEECASYDECALLSPFIAAGKAVFNVEYVDDMAEGPALAAAVCDDALALELSTLIKEWDLGPWRLPC